MSDKHRRRLNRQFDKIARQSPAVHSVVMFVTGDLGFPLRLALAVLLMAGGLLWFLPVVGLWMLPLGLLLLAYDVPALRPCVSGAIIRARRAWSRWRRRRRAAQARKTR